MTFAEFKDELMHRVEVALPEYLPPEHHACIPAIMQDVRHSTDMSHLGSYIDGETFSEEDWRVMVTGAAKNTAAGHMRAAARRLNAS